MDDNEFLQALGAKIHDLRKNKKISQTELAEKIGTKHTAIGRLERGEVNTSVLMLRKIAHELEVTLNELISI
ncbi:MAG TPA: helix-turn-helix transcriptional regulator [Bacteroidia bacterium]|nr:helix-turn-helix transcriptional regulator [Bacteroidia bacterium]